ncbi:hypothetical protein D3C71_1838370 [compost metagenome]
MIEHVILATEEGIQVLLLQVKLVLHSFAGQDIVPAFHEFRQLIHRLGQSLEVGLDFMKADILPIYRKFLQQRGHAAWIFAFVDSAFDLPVQGIHAILLLLQ